jgi:hypothetical protein
MLELMTSVLVGPTRSSLPFMPRHREAASIGRMPRCSRSISPRSSHPDTFKSLVDESRPAHQGDAVASEPEAECCCPAREAWTDACAAGEGRHSHSTPDLGRAG